MKERDRKLYKIGEAAEQHGITIRALRYYKEEGQVALQRSEKGTRWYSQGHIDRLRAIQKLVANGYALDPVRVLIHTGERAESGDQRQRAIVALLDGYLDDAHESIHRLQALAD